MIGKLFDSSTLLFLLLAAAIIATSVLALNYALRPTMDRVEWQEALYTVQSGDTLWAISRGYCPDNVDRREWIDAVLELNELQDAIIHPGQTLIVWAPIK